MDIIKEIANLPTLTFKELQEMWVQYFHTKPLSNNKEFYIARLAYRLQELHFGGLSSSTQSLLTHMNKEVAKETFAKHYLPPIGSRIIKQYHGKEYTICILKDGFDLDGVFYKSLSGVALKITGQKISGRRFFGF